jgi:hypothetical protein
VLSTNGFADDLHRNESDQIGRFKITGRELGDADVGHLNTQFLA